MLNGDIGVFSLCYAPTAGSSFVRKDPGKTPAAPFPARRCFKEGSPAGHREATTSTGAWLPYTFLMVTGHFGIASGKG